MMIYWGYNPLILTFYQHFQRDIQIGGWTRIPVFSQIDGDPNLPTSSNAGMSIPKDPGMSSETDFLNPILFWGRDLDHQSYEFSGEVWILRDRIKHQIWPQSSGLRKNRWVSFGCFPKLWYPQIIHFNGGFHIFRNIHFYVYPRNDHISPPFRKFGTISDSKVGICEFRSPGGYPQLPKHMGVSKNRGTVPQNGWWK